MQRNTESHHVSRRRLLTTLVATTFSGVLAGCQGTGGSQQDTTTATTTTATDQTTGETATDAAATPTAVVGEVVSGNTLSMVVRDVRTTDAISPIVRAGDGNLLVEVTIAVKNLTQARSVRISSFLQTTVVDAAGTSYNRLLLGSGEIVGLGELVPGEVLREGLVYEVPADASGLRFRLDTPAGRLFGSDSLVVDLERRADQVADVQQDLRVPVRSPGETVTREGIVVGVDDVRTESFRPLAASGNEFIVPSLTVTNQRDESALVVARLQSAVKDASGRVFPNAVVATATLDEALPVVFELPAGESRTGDLAYEVPATDDPLYWTFDFSVPRTGDKEFWQLR